MKRYAATILVELRPDLLDPQGLATEKAINQLDIGSVEKTRIGKVIRLTILEESKKKAKEKIERISKEFLSNPVIETYTFELKELSP
jgi:phosphoribosylformylglycinamidine synthase